VIRLSDAAHCLEYIAKTTQTAWKCYGLACRPAVMGSNTASGEMRRTGEIAADYHAFSCRLTSDPIGIIYVRCTGNTLFPIML